MATQQDVAFINTTITSSATALSIYDLLVAAGFTPTSGCVALNVTVDQNTYWGNVSTVTNSTGVLRLASAVFSDSATGAGGNLIPIGHMFIYQNAGPIANAVIYARFIP